MNELQKKFTEKLEKWAASDHSSDERIIEGMRLVYKIVPNQALMQQVIRTPQRMRKKVEYEVEKHLKYRRKDLVRNDVIRLEREVNEMITPAISAEDSVSEDEKAEMSVLYVDGKLRGKRADHDEMPEVIKKLWTDNAERWKKIKATYNECQECEDTCDRYELLVVLREAWYKYKADMWLYDSYKQGDDTSKLEKNDAEMTVANARSYISKNKSKLAEAVEQGDEEAILKWRTKIQECVDYLIKAEATFKPAQIEELKYYSLNVDGARTQD
ncbi:MAG: hypothetical protein ACI3Y0_04960 [Prevotella sp.]